MEEILKDGMHYLSGIDTYSYEDELGYKEGVLIILDGVTVDCYLDHDDGYRSYGGMKEADASMKCQHTFPPQPVKLIHGGIHEYPTETNWFSTEQEYITLVDAVTNKEVLKVGTDSTDGYYPMAIFEYTPENLFINQSR